MATMRPMNAPTQTTAMTILVSWEPSRPLPREDGVDVDVADARLGGAEEVVKEAEGVASWLVDEDSTDNEALEATLLGALDVCCCSDGEPGEVASGGGAELARSVDAASALSAMETAMVATRVLCNRNDHGQDLESRGNKGSERPSWWNTRMVPLHAAYPTQGTSPRSSVHTPACGLMECCQQLVLFAGRRVRPTPVGQQRVGVGPRPHPRARGDRLP